MAFGGNRVILLADTNILIDLEYVGGIGVLPQLADCEVLDVVLAECENEKQPLIIQHIEQAGITVIETSRELALRASALRRGGVSTIDMMTFCHAREQGHTVLTGDRPLRERCSEEGVDYRGSFWIVEEIHRQGLLDAAELLRWLTVWPQVGRRLPKAELGRLRQILENNP
jgi:predicted nucleic acid-binding protein